MPSPIKERIETDLKQAKETGQLRVDRVREIVQSAVSQVASELKAGSSDIRLIVKDAILAVIENAREKGGEVKEEVTASIEGAIEGLSQARRQNISKTQAEVKQLQAKLDSEEAELEQEIDTILTDVEQVGAETSPSDKASIEAAISALKNSEEAALLKKRYAQLQAQLAILRANLTARYGGRHEEVQEYLDEAKNWYDRAHAQAEVVVDQVEQQRSRLEEKLGDAGTALARRERRIRQILSDLLQSAADIVRDKHPSGKP